MFGARERKNMVFCCHEPHTIYQNILLFYMNKISYKVGRRTAILEMNTWALMKSHLVLATALRIIIFFFRHKRKQNVKFFFSFSLSYSPGTVFLFLLLIVKLLTKLFVHSLSERLLQYLHKFRHLYEQFFSSSFFLLNKCQHIPDKRKSALK